MTNLNMQIGLALVRNNRFNLLIFNRLSNIKQVPNSLKFLLLLELILFVI
jgi:hypothetical protein